MSVEEHRKQAPKSIACAVVTVSDTRRGAQDTGGAYLVEALEAAGHRILERRWVHDEPAEILESLDAILDAPGPVQAILFTGGTGVAARDCTVDALEPRIELLLPGFGELFRSLSYAEIGSASMLSRACGGVIDRRFVCALPGSRRALKLAMEALILPELGHLIRHLGE